ncbi:MAG TPA: RteC domain-containing protein [Cytophagaceae bacterium]|jgi:hypothetical protein|nr:RteC domain-containing protein [Cytophagaceae bacterium]
MITHFSKVRVQLEQDLDNISLEETNTLYAAKKSLVVVRDCCRKLSTIHLQCDFKTREEEIYFFKELKCYYYSQLYYYQDIIEIETGLPNGSKKLKQIFLKEQLNKLTRHFSNNRFLYIYYRSEGTASDYQFFSSIKKYDTKYDDDGKEIFCEDDYSCTYDFLYARVISNDRLEKYLHKEIAKLEEVETQSQTNSALRSKLEWTESKTALVELLYALQTSQCINGGRVDVKELAELIKRIFPNVDLTDYYRTYIDIRNRKNNRTKFMDSLRNSLVERFDRDEDR